MKYSILLVVWLLFGNQQLYAQNPDPNLGQPIEMKGRKFSKGTATNIKLGFNMQRLEPYLEGDSAKNTFAQVKELNRKGTLTLVASSALTVLSISLMSTGFPGFLMLKISSVTGYVPLVYYTKSGQLVMQAIAEHNAFVGEEVPASTPATYK